MLPDDGCCVQPKLVAAILFAIIKVVCQQVTFILLRPLSSLKCTKIVERISDILSILKYRRKYMSLGENKK